jgi:phenylalanyl-tRNA synthetase beta chain
VSPEWYLRALDRIKPGHSLLGLQIRNEVPELVPRFMAVVLADVELKPSPVIMQTYLSRLGIRPINNIVDMTNYLMVLTGQPLHAYDYDKVRSLDDKETATIVIRKPREHETLTLLNGKTIEPRADAIMIASESQAIGLGGVMGGGSTEVDEHTKNIILEVATFDMYSIRRTSMTHGLFTDAVTRFTKGQSHLQNDRVLEEAVALVQSLSGAHVASDVIDDQHLQMTMHPVEVSADFINQRLGSQLSAADMGRLLQNVEF